MKRLLLNCALVIFGLGFTGAALAAMPQIELAIDKHTLTA